ncbi:restriction endonuclease subunit S [Marinobacter shengliensis]|uniref:restriction endonuclease subunit S n=1 Tax=Marinobacter shengliensis TaxID=1389223 RepID=UPI001E428D09|nr:restriction endonuclease subunit S [Marinobacter shengliensis]MCD1630168.1 restriction endonuclease subunit S [Marinobacter shengliensis]
MSNTVPSGWSVHELGDLAHKIEGGGTPSRTEASFWNGDIPWATVKDLRAVSLRSTEEHITELGLKNSSSKLVPANTMIIATRMAVGKAVFFNRDVAINQDLKAFHPKSETNWRFLLQWYLANSEKIENLATGSTVKGIRLDELRLLPIDLPPLPEQQKIATILSSVDDVIEKTRAQIDKLKDLKTGMMQELLTKGVGSGGVPHTEFKNSPVGRIPSSWGYELLESVATIQTGIAKNAKTEGDMIEVPYLRVANVQDGYLDLSEIKSIRIDRSRLERFSLKDEDVLVNEGGDFDKLGRGAIWDGQISPCVHQNHVFVVRTDKSYLLPRFFNYLSGSQHGKKYYLGCAKQTTNLASLNSSQLKAFPVLLPPLEEQAAICDILTSLDSKITLTERKKATVEALKKALMQDLLTGRVRVNVEKEALSHVE